MLVVILKILVSIIIKIIITNLDLEEFLYSRDKMYNSNKFIDRVENLNSNLHNEIEIK